MAAREALQLEFYIDPRVGKDYVPTHRQPIETPLTDRVCQECIKGGGRFRLRPDTRFCNIGRAAAVFPNLQGKPMNARLSSDPTSPGRFLCTSTDKQQS